MKKLIVGAGIALAMTATMLQAANAQGLSLTGTVNASATTISGAMNNRWNTAATAATTYIYANGFANSTVTFAGRGQDGTFFSCFVVPGNALYSAAVDIKNSLQDGGFLYASKTTTSNACTNVYLLNASYWLH